MNSDDDGRAMGRTARETLNELRWRTPDLLADAIIFYRDRTRPEEFRTIRGSKIVGLERKYFTTARGRFPYYKIDRIEVAGRSRFQRTVVSGRPSAGQ